MTELLSVVIPYIDSDAHLMKRAAASVAAQTVDVICIPVHDVDRRGPQWARNHGLSLVETPFVTWLDADDWLEPDFAEKTLAAYRPNHYVVTDHWRGDVHQRHPDPLPRCGMYGNAGTVTRLIRTETARKVGGFNESLKRLEDTEFWLRVRAAGICAIHIPEPLMQYSPGGARSTRHKDPAQLMNEINNLYLRYNMACCGGDAVVRQASGKKQDGDVLAAAMWGGNRTVLGRRTGRQYPRTGNGKQLWVDPRDVDGELFVRVEEPQEPISEEPLKTGGDDENATIIAKGREYIAQHLNALTKQEIADFATSYGLEISTSKTKDEMIAEVVDGLSFHQIDAVRAQLEADANAD